MGNNNKICNSNHDNNHHNNSNGSKNASNVKNWLVLIQGWGLWQCSEVRSLSPMYIYMYIDIVLYTVYYILYIIYYILYTGYLHICIHIRGIHYIETLSIYIYDREPLRVYLDVQFEYYLISIHYSINSIK